MNPTVDDHEAALDVKDLNIGFQLSRVPVVADITIALSPGEVLGVVGESGSGKTTFGLGLLRHTRPGLRILSGSVSIAGTDLVGLGATKLQQFRGRRVAYVPQDPASGLNPALRLDRQLRETLEAHADALQPGESADARIDDMLNQVGLPPDRVRASYPHQLSGGQLQRAAIAMAVLARPSVVVLDEPTTGLDVSTQRRILNLVRELARDYQCAAVYVSHDLPVVAELADRVVVMYAGRVVEHGPAALVLQTPGHPYTIGLLRAVPEVDEAKRLTGIAGQPPRPGSWPDGCAFANRCELVIDACRESVPQLLPRGLTDTRCIRTESARSLPLGASLAVDRTQQRAEEPLLRVSDLKAFYGRSEVLHGVELEVFAGQTVAVVGESGSGKTTLARCLSGLHTRWEGTATFDGQPLALQSKDRQPDQRRAIQYVFQNPYNALNPKKTVGEILEAPLLQFFKLKRRDRAAKVEQTLVDVALNAQFAGRYPFQLSGGERQRVAIARALIVDPSLLICDEVTSALDVSVQAAIIEQLRELQDQRGVSMLFITHNLAVARSVAQEIVVFNQGRIVERGPSDTVLDAPTDPYTIGLLKDVPRMHDEVDHKGSTTSTAMGAPATSATTSAR